MLWSCKCKCCQCFGAHLLINEEFICKNWFIHFIMLFFLLCYLYFFQNNWFDCYYLESIIKNMIFENRVVCFCKRTLQKTLGSVLGCVWFEKVHVSGRDLGVFRPPAHWEFSELQNKNVFVKSSWFLYDILLWICGLSSVNMKQNSQAFLHSCNVLQHTLL